MRRIIDSVEFEIVEKIAEGGQGSVYKALQKGVDGFEKTVAIKTMLGEFSKMPQFVDMFVSEAKLVANLVHENIVQIYQLGQTDDMHYFVLEYINGISLHDFLSFHHKLGESLPRELAVYITSRIARGLAYAHSRSDAEGNPLNIVHCDVCPQNILITTEGLPKLTDFGIAKARTMSVKRSLSGKILYMSPEQANEQDLDFRSDIYSLGAVLFYMLTGKTIRRISDDFNDILRQAKEAFVDWDHLLELNLDPALLDIVKRMLAEDPDDRYASTDNLGRDLEYHIYKDGYGPTIVTLSNYMKKQMPYIFTNQQRDLDNEKTRVDKTRVL